MWGGAIVVEIRYYAGDGAHIRGFCFGNEIKVIQQHRIVFQYEPKWDEI